MSRFNDKLAELRAAQERREARDLVRITTRPVASRIVVDFRAATRAGADGCEATAQLLIDDNDSIAQHLCAAHIAQGRSACDWAAMARDVALALRIPLPSGAEFWTAVDCARFAPRFDNFFTIDDINVIIGIVQWRAYNPPD